jgi:putative PIN family toxin of toxin-antitoxin system
MLRVVLDTSCMVSYALTRGKLMRQVIAHWQTGTFTVLSSPATRAELTSVLARPTIQQRAVVSLEEMVSGLARFSEHVPGKLQLVGACRDPKDDKFLACAMEGQAQYLVTSDRDLLALRHYRDIAVVNPGQFLVALELYRMDAETLAARFKSEVLAEIAETIPLDPNTAAYVSKALAPRGVQAASATRKTPFPRQSGGTDNQ